jgi:prepilin-type N-terminal cleavage/methylation domain-containing protein/prepilin-type processing-associated H-X9-DG protein
MKARGFTVTEMMVVIAIIAILSTLGAGFSLKMVARAKESACLTNLAAIGGAVDNYVRDNGGRLPTLEPGRKTKKSGAAVMDTVLLPYVQGERIFCCPAGEKTFRETGCSYFWNSSLNGSTIAGASFLGMTNQPESIPLATDKEAWHPHDTNILYVDGSASRDIRFSTGSTKK